MDQENEQPKELSKREVSSIRSGVAKAVWEGKEYEQSSPDEDNDETHTDEPTETPDTDTKLKKTKKEPEKEEKEAEPEDVWKDVPDHVKTEIESLRKSVGGFQDVTYRLKKSEQRIGALEARNKELETALATAKEEKASLTKKEQEAQQQEAEKRWNIFKEDAPEVADAVENRVKSATGKVPTAEELVTAVKSSLKEDIAGLIPKTDGYATKEDFITLTHPTWKKDLYTTSATGQVVYSEKFTEFLKAHPDNVPKCDSQDIGDVIMVLDAFDEFKKPKKSTTDIKQEQEERLRQSATDTVGGPSEKEKALSDKDPDEIRAEVSKRAYDSFEI